MIYAADALVLLALGLAAHFGGRLPHPRPVRPARGAHARRRFTIKGNAR